MPVTTQAGKRYMPGLDGLRAIAVLSVIAYHLNFGWAQGGFLGVVIFFVLSGYLITNLLIQEWEQTGHINLKNFWIRRIRRLLPALLLMLMVVMAWITIFQPSLISKAWPDLIASLFYVSNWWFIFHKVSYFESFGTPSPFNHLWSLAVEEQFYIFWPFILGILMVVFRRQRILLFFALLTGLLSAVLMAMLYHPGTDPSRVYYGTDTRLFSLLLGGCLAVLWPSHKLSKNAPKIAVFTMDLVGILGLLFLIWMLVMTNEYSSFLYRGGMFLTSIVSLAVIANLAHPASLLSKIMGCLPLRWIGARSYGIYLWHYPIIILSSTLKNTGHLLTIILQLIAIILVSHLSFSLIEKPILKGGSAKVNSSKKTFKPAFIGYKLLASTIVLMLGVCTFGIISNARLNDHELPAIKIKDVSAFADDSTLVKRQKGTDIPPTSNSPAEKEPSIAVTNKASTQSPQKEEAQKNQIPAKSTEPPSNITTVPAKKQPVVKSNPNLPKNSFTFIGDSVMADVAPYIKKLIPNAVIDAKVGRQMPEALSVVQQLKTRGLLGDTVVIELGTNGAFTINQMNTLVKEIGVSKRIIFINTSVPRPWEQEVNSTLVKIASSLPNSNLINWYEKSNGRPDYFYQDDVHPNPKGAQVYAEMVARSIKN